MRRLLPIGCLATLALAGCGGGGGGATLTTSDLPNLVLRANEAPPGLSYSQRDSGQGELEKKNGEAAVSSLRSLGLQGDYVTKFLSTNGQSSISSAESIALVFKSSSGASKMLQQAKQQATGRGTVATEIPTDGLGDEAWGLRGSFFSSQAPITYFYTWRIGNAVMSLIVSGGDQSSARALADKINTHATGASS